MSKIKEYFTVTGYGTDDFDKKVNRKLDDGFIPIGGLSITANILSESGYIFAQAMVKLHDT